MTLFHAGQHVLRLARNTRGRDIVVGDIHGHYARLERELARIRFDPDIDRLIAVGDLVDRGPDSDLACVWLAQPWFYSVRGNHDASLLRLGDAGALSADWRADDHNWYRGLGDVMQGALQSALAKLPWAIEIETPTGLIGVVHAEVPEAYADWRDFVDALAAPWGDDARWGAAWGRTLHGYALDVADPALDPDDYRLAGVEWVLYGHSLAPDLAVRRLGNRLWLDTGGWLESAGGSAAPGHRHHPPRFTLVDVRDPLWSL